jgi:hypothetical protein
MKSHATESKKICRTYSLKELLKPDKCKNSIIRKQIIQLRNGQKIWTDSSPKVKSINHMERYPTSYAIREWQIKTIRYHFTPAGMAKIQKLTMPSLSPGMDAGLQNSHSLSLGTQNGTC